MRNLLLNPILFAAILLSGVAAAQQQSVNEYAAMIERMQPDPGENGLGALTLQELTERFNVPGISVAVIRDFRIDWAKAYGIADVTTGEPVDVDTVFQAASISKPVTAMAVLKAVQQGMFALDDDINDVLTSWQLETGDFTRERPVTLRTLASHTSGLGDGFGFPGYDPAGPIPTVLQILEGQPPANTRRLFMERPPLTVMEYSGGGYTLLQQALEDAYQKPFGDILRDEVLLPVGMVNSTFEFQSPSGPDLNAARAHDSEGRSLEVKWHQYPELAAAGLWTTPTDLALFAIEIQKSAIGASNKVLGQTIVQEMLAPVGVGEYSVGFQIWNLGQGWYFRHGGSNWGYRAELLAHKVHGYGYVIMTNSDQGDQVALEVRARIQRAYGWDSLASAAPPSYDPQ